MPTVQMKRFNWLRAPTFWEQARATREHHREMTKDFLDTSAAASAVFARAANDQTSGNVLLTAQTALARVQAAARAKLDLSA